MGNFLSSSNTSSSRFDHANQTNLEIARLQELQKLQELQDRLSRLERLDANKDGEISKKEFQDWKKKQESDLQAFRERIIKQETLRHQKDLLEKETELTRLREELQSLKTLFNRRGREAQAEKEKLIAALASAGSPTSTDSGPAQTLSEEQIRSFVEELLSDETINIGYLPDWVERQLYVNFFNLLIGLLRKTVSTTSLQLIGHEIKMVMLPNAKLNETKQETTSGDTVEE